MANLPYDAEVEYLESTGTQWIDTGIQGQDGLDFAYQASFSTVSAANGIGGEYDKDNDSSFYLGLIRTNGYFAYHYAGTTAPIQVQQVQANHVYDITGHFYSGSQYMTIDGVRGGDGTIVDSFTSNKTLYLFSINYTPPTPGMCKLYNFSLSRYGQTLRNMIPVRFTNENGISEGAMYDKVTGQLFRNSGTISFIVGPDVVKRKLCLGKVEVPELPSKGGVWLGKKPVKQVWLGKSLVWKRLPYDAEVEYLQSTGTQWINTGVLPATRDNVRFDLQVGYSSGYSGRRFVLSDGNSAVAHYAEITTGNKWGINSASNAPAYVANNLYSAYIMFSSSNAKLGTTVDNNYYSWTNTGYPSSNWGMLRLFILSGGYLGRGVRIGICEINVNNLLVRDFIPVRFTNEDGVLEGAMYDRNGIGGMNPDGSARNDGLYRNRGTGAFVIGPDKT